MYVIVLRNTVLRLKHRGQGTKEGENNWRLSRTFENGAPYEGNTEIGGRCETM